VQEESEYDDESEEEEKPKKKKAGGAAAKSAAGGVAAAAGKGGEEKDPWGLGGTKCSKDWRHMTAVRFKMRICIPRINLTLRLLWGKG